MKNLLLTALATLSLTATAGEITPGKYLSVHGRIAAPTTAGTFQAKCGLYNLANAKIVPSGTVSVSDTHTESGLVTDPQGTKARYGMACDIYLSGIGAVHIGGFGAESITTDDGKAFYTRALTLNFFQQGYSEGIIDGDKIVFKSGQYVYDTADGEKAYMYGAKIMEEDGWPVITDSFTLTKDAEDRYVSEQDCYMLILTEEAASEEIDSTTDFICFGTNYVFTPLPADIKQATMPADAEIKECQMIANSLLEYGETTMTDITIGIKGENIYIGGLSEYLPDAYLVGTKSGENTYTFESHQYIGDHDNGDYPYIYEFALANPIYFDGEGLYYKEADSLTMTFDEEQSTLYMEENAGIIVCAYGDPVSWNELYWNVKIGDFNRPLTPQPATGVECYGSYGTPYVIFEWSDTSVEGLPMIGDQLWCELIINGETYEFTPEYYEGLEKSSDRVYYTITGVEGLYTGSFSTLYLKEFEDRSSEIKTIGVRIGYEGAGETKYTDIVYAKGYEPFEDEAFTPSSPYGLVYYKDYYNNIRFKFDGKDTEGKEIPARLLAAEILLDGKPLVFNNSDYYFNGYEDREETIVGLSEYSVNYSGSLVSSFGGEYLLSLWGHDELPEFKEISVRIVCTGGNTLTYSEPFALNLERAATPADPWDVEYDEDSMTLTFGSLPIDTYGDGLAPWSYGYEVYVNDALYTFEADLYDLEENITVIPFGGFEYNYYFYLMSQNIYDETDWSVIGNTVTMDVDMGNGEPEINKIGVRAVFTDAEGNKTYSKIVNSDGTSGDVSGIESVIGNEDSIRWFDMQGMEVARPAKGGIYVRTQGGKTTKVVFK